MMAVALNGGSLQRDWTVEPRMAAGRRGMSRRNRSWGFLSIALMGLLAAPLFAGTPNLIQFQSKIVDSTGTPRDGTFTINFSLYSAAWTPPAAPAAAALVWSETQAGVQVSKGILSVQLGSQNAIDPTIFDGQTKYLQVTVDGAPLPQPIPFVSVPYAMSAGSLNGTTGDQLVPVGTIVDWYRPSTTTPVPANWKICDGSVVTNEPLSPFNGQAVPNLLGRFVRGINPGLVGSYGGGNLPDQGGQDSVGVSLAHTHSIGSHTHSISPDGGHSHGGFVGTANGDIPASTPNLVPSTTSSSGAAYLLSLLGPGADTTHMPIATSSVPNHNHTGATGAATGDTGPSTLPSATVTTVPAYVGLLKIIRIK
jgi:hypothetical protein